ncbi:uncharacterized protein LOC126682015 [Mercurialis annua]|uniref:uncharacterized protein LOC126682015 n=1 Tax=Mercurialis annua TaxID=3986 RepID=UPI00215E8A11|nr:uncharacterized protein LOC126682015 [Mercurialis annua]
MALPLSSRTYLLLLRSTSTAPSSRLFYARPQSTLPSPPNHADLADDHSTDPLLRKLEDAIHRIIVRRAAPDWLPFIPGSSYWVPPHRSTAGIASLVEKLASPLTDEQSLSTTTIHSWPSSDPLCTHD